MIDAVTAGDGAPSAKLFTDRWEEEKLWQVRESGLGATAQVPGMPRSHPGWEDAAVPPDRVGDYLRDFRDLLDEFGYQAALYGHFGQGCIHCRIDFTLDTMHGVTVWRQFLERAAALVVSYGGSLSGEHGDGQARAALLTTMFGEELVGAFAEFKDLWDPDGGMNPGKVVRPYRPEENLRLGPDASLRHVRTHFAFADDHYDFAHAANRCVGVGKCRDVESGTMCPSYMVTREEQDSTRDGRGCCSRCSGARSSTAGATTPSPTRWTCASRARAARPTAPSTWTWPPTRPSSSRTTTHDGSVRASGTRWDSSTGGRVRRAVHRVS